MKGYFNPRSPHGERRFVRTSGYPTLLISIHAPRTGSDETMKIMHKVTITFQSTLPARGATAASRRDAQQVGFQSTLPARGATAAMIARSTRTSYFNPRSPHGERRFHVYCDTLLHVISIHAPRTGSDCGWCFPSAHTETDFNPRSPHGERPVAGFAAGKIAQNFNPRSPHGERPLRSLTAESAS